MVLSGIYPAFGAFKLINSHKLNIFLASSSVYTIITAILSSTFGARGDMQINKSRTNMNIHEPSRDTKNLKQMIKLDFMFILI